MTTAKKLRLATGHGHAVGGTPQFINLDMDTTGHKFSAVLQAESTAPITHVGISIDNRNGTPPTFKFGLQGVDANGLPDGTYLGGGSPASGTGVPAAQSSFEWFALDNAFTPTRGQVMAVVMEYSSGTINASNTVDIFYRVSNWDEESMFPYTLTNTGAGWVKNSVTHWCGMAIRTASTRTGFPIIAWSGNTTVTTSTHRQALSFTLPAGHGDTFKVLGAFLRMISPAVGNTFKFGLWDASSELQAVTMDTDNFAAVGADKSAYFYFDESTLSTLSYGTLYYLGVEATGTAVGITRWDIFHADNRLCFPGGDDFGYATYNGTSWSDDNTLRPWVDLLIDDITEPAGGGGGGIIKQAGNGGGMVG